MFGYSEEKEQIAALEKALGDLQERVKAERRTMTNFESGLARDISSKIEDLKMSLPNEPLTLERNFRNFSSRSTGGFTSFGEQMAAITSASIPGGRQDPRLFNATGLGESVPSDGSFLIQQDFSNQLLADIFDTSQLARRCRRIQLSGNSNGIKINGFDETSRATGSRFGGARGYWVDEASEITASKPKFRRIELSLKKLTGLVYATNEMLEDYQALGEVLRSAFTAELQFMLDDAIMNGTGAGQPLGIMNAGCLVSVAAEDGQASATVLAENVFKMYARLLPGSERSACWVINKNVLPQLFSMSVAVGTGGGPVFMPSGGISGKPYNSLLGLPIVIAEQAQTLGTAGDIVLADFSNGYILAEKGGIRTEVSIHVKFVYDESVYRVAYRVDGQPVRASALTPFKGSDTLSHFVALATRA
ncbi:MAG: phage major capsid protein [Desulfobacterales bacterium]|jgi:HK97 family phage major capsid protein|nr:phage major capsid protein [Desulfobacterales bacterium]